jgi:hypothetical protein
MDDFFDRVNPDIVITTTHIENAIGALLTKYVEQREDPACTQQVWEKEIVTMGEIPVGRQAELLELVEDPIRHSLRRSLIRLIEFLHEEIKKSNNQGVAYEFEKSFYRIVGIDKEKDGIRGSILDKFFDGIGGWRA